jgi:methylmalonyl-CoA/ethylmalonyl-CoA epimerase
MRVKRVERVAIAVADLDAARDFFERALGAEFHPVEEVADQGFRYQPFTVAGFRLELLCPTRDDDSVIARFLRERGPGVHHVSFEVEDLDQAVAELERDGIHVVHRIDYPEGVVFEGQRWREAFVHPRAAMGVLLHVCEKKPA